ncbi:hypothetical protein Ancab_017557, partial [Ancistrocladus abbreviatus]
QNKCAMVASADSKRGEKKTESVEIGKNVDFGWNGVKGFGVWVRLGREVGVSCGKLGANKKLTSHSK